MLNSLKPRIAKPRIAKPRPTLGWKAYVSPANIKLGNIPSFSTPPIETCPGRTSECSGCNGSKHYCYIIKMIKLRPSIGVSYARNLDAILSDNFILPVSRYISKNKPKMFRFSVGGDIFSSKYAEDIAKLVNMFPEVKFLAFTRSWRIKSLADDIAKLQKLKNLQLIASMDNETEQAPLVYRRAYAGKPMHPKRKTILCPGYGPKELTCEDCGLCFKSANVDIYFPIH